jgi:hypothetical protein
MLVFISKEILTRKSSGGHQARKRKKGGKNWFLIFNSGFSFFL